jgi:protein-S-isoprenylcysteine O-methyltransferase Ste14
VLAVMVAAYGMHQWIPLSLPYSVLLRWFGGGLMLIAMLILSGSVLAFFRNNTAIEPWKPARTLITNGFYGFSRNPIYLGFFLFQMGLGLYLAQAWMLLTVIVSEGWIYRLVIKKEEHYLEQTFGDAYLEYKSKVRRYL